MGKQDDDYEDYYLDDDDDDDARPAVPAVVPDSVPVLPVLLDRLGLGHVTTRDEITIKYDPKTRSIKGVVKRPGGVAQTSTRNTSAGFRTMTEFVPTGDKAARNRQIRHLYKKGATQQSLAEQFGLSQAMIHNIVNSDD